ncbi:MAG: ATP-binding protein [Nanoarchaeota archaeon]|nr:ATP-binding protein [Nanoarchaeota archaeon]
MDYNQLLEQNVWWKSKEEIDSDITLQRLKEKKVFWDPKLKEKLSFKQFSFNIIIGPRQAGKTTAIKLLIKELLDSHEPKQLFYFSCDELTGPNEVIELIEAYLKIKKAEGIKNSIIFLDEITSPQNWAKAIKSLIDKGRLEGDVLVATGSNSIRVKREAEYFPGRRGAGRDVLLLPIGFRRFVEVLHPEIIARVPMANDFSRKSVKKALTAAMNYCRELNSHLEQYFETGGFPLAINALKTNSSLYYAKKSYQDGFISDILKIGADIKTARDVISAIMEKMPSHFSYNNIGNDIGKSAKTVEYYTQLFADIFSIVVLNNVDISAKIPKLGKNKKMHFLDPLMAKVFKDWSLSERGIDKSFLAETVLVANMAMLDFSNFSIGERLCYWSNSNEIDLVARGKALMGIEVKWSNKIETGKYLKHSSHFKELYFLSKDSYIPEKNIFPLACFLAVLGDKTMLRY